MHRVPKIDHLLALRAVRTHVTVARAALVLHLTPSAVSQQLAKLESDVGVRLLRRQGREVRLTRAGTVLAGSADRIVEELGSALDAVGELSQDDRH